MPKASDTHPTGYVTGAGAHFSWIIFKTLQKDLEQVSGRKIKLYGKDSMLGQGCNAGIKNASLNGPGKESFGFICCPLSQAEIDKEKIIVYPLALEPILILVNQTNPVSNLSKQQVHLSHRTELLFSYFSAGTKQYPKISLPSPSSCITSISSSTSCPILKVPASAPNNRVHILTPSGSST